MPRTASNLQTKEVRKDTLLGPPETAVLTPTCPASRLQNDERRYFCCFKLLSKWYFFFFPTNSATIKVQFRSVAQSCPTLCDPMNRSTPDLPVHYQLLEFTQTHIHQVGETSSHLILCLPLFLLPPICPSIRIFSSESTLGQSTGVSASASFPPKKSQG